MRLKTCDYAKDGKCNFNGGVAEDCIGTECLVFKSEIHKLNCENKRLNEIIVKDNRHINKLDKENEAHKQRIVVLERALKGACYTPDEEKLYVKQAEESIELEKRLEEESPNIPIY